MATNGENSIEDTDMAECDEEKVVTMVDVLKEQQDFEEAANAVLGASDDKNCTYSKGYIKRQAIYACMTCCAESKDDPSKRAGMCLACSLICHEKHDLIELYTKRNFRCDCGNPKFNSHPCRFTSNKDDLNEDNIYNQNFSGLYCTCHRPYPDPNCPEMDDMIQCIICEDWYHALHLESPVPVNDRFAEMICKDCMEKNEFLHDYSDYAVNTENADIDVVYTNNSITQELITNGEKILCHTNTSDDVEMDENRTIEKNHQSSTTINETLDDKNEKQNDLEKSNLDHSEPKQDEIIESLEKLLDSDKTITNDENMQEINNDNTLNEYANVSNKESLVESKNEINTSDMEIQENEKLNVSESVENEKDARTEELNIPDTEKIDEDYLLAEDSISEENKQENDFISDNNEFDETLKTNDYNKVDEHIPELSQTVDKQLEVTSEIEKTEEEKLSDIKNTDDKSQEVQDDHLLNENPIPEENKHQNDLICDKNEIDENLKTHDYNKEDENVSESTPTQLDEQLEKAPIEIEKAEEEKLLDEQQQYVEEKSQGEEPMKDVSDESKVNDNNFESTGIENFEEYAISKDSDSLDPMKNEENILKDANETKLNEDYVNTNETKLDKDYDEESNTDETKESEDVKTSDPNAGEVCQEQLADKNLDEQSSNELKEQTNGYSEDIEINNENLESSQIDKNETNLETPKPAETIVEQIVSENKRKLSVEDATPEDDLSVKKTKPNEYSICLRPNGAKRIYKGATFWPSNFRQKLCTCNECITMYKDLSVLFLIDPEDTVSAYTCLGQSKGLQSQYEKGLEALSSLDRIQQINAITEYNNLRDKLLDFLKSFKERQEVVKEEDIQAFFANIKPKREPDGVYFCR